MKKITIHSPATIANLVCGFDILGLCLEEPYDRMELKMNDSGKLMIKSLGAHSLPEDPLQNTAGVALLELMAQVSPETGFDLTITKNIKPGSGLGSSAASSTGAVVAANHLLSNRFSREECVRFAMQGEKLASGVKHADNVSPGIYGGITLIRSIFPLDIVPVDYPPLFVTVVHPQIEIKTSDARQILRQQVQLRDAIRQWGNIAGLVTGLMRGDYALIGRSLEDVIIEPVRSILIPHFDEIKKAAREAGVLGGGIAGSGPSLFMLSADRATAAQAEEAITAIYNRIGLEHHSYVTTINPQGCRIISES